MHPWIPKTASHLLPQGREIKSFSWSQVPTPLWPHSLVMEERKIVYILSNILVTWCKQLYCIINKYYELKTSLFLDRIHLCLLPYILLFTEALLISASSLSLDKQSSKALPFNFGPYQLPVSLQFLLPPTLTVLLCYFSSLFKTKDQLPRFPLLVFS